MIRLYDNESGADLGEISEAQLKFLIDQLEETELTDQDYYLDASTLQMLDAAGGDPVLLDLLREGLGDQSGFEIRWARE